MNTAQITLENKVNYCSRCEKFEDENKVYVEVPIELADFYFNHCDVNFEYCPKCKKEVNPYDRI